MELLTKSAALWHLLTPPNNFARQGCCSHKKVTDLTNTPWRMQSTKAEFQQSFKLWRKFLTKVSLADTPKQGYNSGQQNGLIIGTLIGCNALYLKFQTLNGIFWRKCLHILTTFDICQPPTRQLLTILQQGFTSGQKSLDWLLAPWEGVQ